MMHTTSSRLTFGLALLWVTACTPWERTPVDPALWQHKQMRIGIATAKTPPAMAVKVGAMGLLDLAINAAMASDLETHLGSLQPTRVPLMANLIETRLQAIGFSTVRIAGQIDPTTLPSRDPTAPGFYDRNVESIATSQGVDAILLLSVRQWGTSRSYYGFIPTDAPRATFVASGQLIARDGRLLWDEMGVASGTTGNDEWDQAPDFPNLTHALDEAEDDAMTWLKRSFFDTAPEPPKAAAAVVRKEGEFDKAAARAALTEAATVAAACTGGSPGEEVDVTVTFAPSGKISSAQVEQGPLVGTPTSDCVATAFQSLTVPSFEGVDLKMHKKVSLGVHP